MTVWSQWLPVCGMSREALPDFRRRRQVDLRGWERQLGAEWGAPPGLNSSMRPLMGKRKQHHAGSTAAFVPTVFMILVGEDGSTP